VARHVVGAVRDLPPGSRKLIFVEGRQIVVFSVQGKFFALLNRCPHQGGNLFDGRLVGQLRAPEPGRYVYCRPGEIIRCPWHGWEFDLRTGQSSCEPRRLRTRTFEVAIEPGSEAHAGPYTAETFRVTVDEPHVLIEV
jgi:3-phenylpropionate/trans-cinnamate dioxygenase ferredoxin subunit